MTRLTTHKHTFDWPKFKGSKEALKWNCRDLTSVDAVLEVTPGRTACIQAGGNLGIFPKYLARVFETVYTFEPAVDLFPILTHNAPEPNIIRIQAALGNAPGFVATACVRRGKPGIAHEGITHIAGPGPIPTLRLDDFMFPTVDLIYLDLEGWEYYALQGAAQTLLRCRPVLAVEVNQNCQHVGLTPDTVREFIGALEYRFVTRIQSDDVYVPAEWV